MWEGKCMQVDTGYLHWPNNLDLHREVKLLKLTINQHCYSVFTKKINLYNVQYFDIIVDHEFMFLITECNKEFMLFLLYFNLTQILITWENLIFGVFACKKFMTTVL